MEYNKMKVISLNNLNFTKVKNIIERSFDGEFKSMDDDTVCLFDISNYKVDGQRSLIIQNNGTIYYSKKTTQEILDDFSASLHSVHEVTSEIASIFGYTQKIPYVIGDRCIIPLDGYSKKPVTWIVATNIVFYDYESDQPVINLFTFEQTVLQIPVSKIVFTKQYDRAAQILKTKLNMLQSIIKSYRGTIRNENFSQKSIVSEQMKKLSYIQKDMTLYEIGKIMVKKNRDQFINFLIQEGFLLEDDKIDYP